MPILSKSEDDAAEKHREGRQQHLAGSGAAEPVPGPHGAN